MTERPPLPDRVERDRIQEDLDTTLLVEAAAGTGKTTSMVGRLVRLLATGKCEARHLAAITFTKKAASELRDRFQSKIAQLSRTSEGIEGERLRKAVAELDQTFIGTIHSFCAKLLRERPIEAGVDLAFTELEDEDDRLLRVRAWEDFCARLHAAGDPAIQRLVELGLSLSDLRETFSEFAKYPDVTEWPAEETPPPDFAKLRKAIEECARHMMATAQNFVLKDTPPDTMAGFYIQVPRLLKWVDLTTPAELMRLAERFTRFPKNQETQKWWQLEGDRCKAKEICQAECERMAEFRGKVIEPALEQWRAHRYPFVLELFKKAQEVYDNTRLGQGRLNYQDLLLKAASLLRDRPAIRKYFRNRFSHLLVDEFQDTDPVQAEVMLFLTASDPSQTDWTECRPVPGSLFVVGDPKQSIYRFRRADIVTYNKVKRIILASGGDVLELSTNFRTVPAIIEPVNRLFAETFEAFGEDYSPRYIPLRPGKEALQQGTSAPISYLWPEAECDSARSGAMAREEARRLALAIRKAVEADPPLDVAVRKPGDFMILTYHRKNLQVYGAALEREGIPYEVTGGTGGAGQELLEAVYRVLAALADPENPVALVAVLRSFPFGIDDNTLLAFRLAGGRFRFLDPPPKTFEAPYSQSLISALGDLKRFSRWVDDLPPTVATEKIAADLGLLPAAAWQEGGNLAVGSLYRILEMARQATAHQSSFRDFVTFFQGAVEGSVEYDGLPARAPDSDCVRLMNLHKAKGLEAPVVILADPAKKGDHSPKIHVERHEGKARGYLEIRGNSLYEWSAGPILAHPAGWKQWQEIEQQFLTAEVERLLYVATTRAGEELLISNALPKGTAGKTSWSSLVAGLSKQGEWPVLALTEEEERDTPPDSDRPSLGISQALAGLEERWAEVSAPSYSTSVAKKLGSQVTPSEESGMDRGRVWGTIIHQLLEAQGKAPQADMRAMAETLLSQEDLHPDLVEEALELVRRVTGSPLWRRAMASPRRFVEVPFSRAIHAENGLPELVNGVIDLVFEEEGGWVIADYKTDRHPESHLPHLTELYRPQLASYKQSWETMTGQPVRETGLYFTHLEHYEKVEV
jgi:ATP-dependent helicase/nuclease subunit A